MERKIITRPIRTAEHGRTTNADAGGAWHGPRTAQQISRNRLLEMTDAGAARFREQLIARGLVIPERPGERRPEERPALMPHMVSWLKGRLIGAGMLRRGAA